MSAILETHTVHRNIIFTAGGIGVTANTGLRTGDKIGGVSALMLKELVLLLKVREGLTVSVGIAPTRTNPHAQKTMSKNILKIKNFILYHDIPPRLDGER